MPRYVALLRGINVGGHRVKMAALRSHFVEMGFEDVSTLLASGNVFFDSAENDADAIEKKIEAHLERELGYEVPAFVRTPDEIRAVAEYAAELSAPSIYVNFLKEAPDSAFRSRLSALDSDTDEFRFRDREIFWLIQCRISDSPLFGRPLDQATRGQTLTNRNLTTLHKLNQKLSSQEA